MTMKGEDHWSRLCLRLLRQIEQSLTPHAIHLPFSSHRLVSPALKGDNEAKESQQYFHSAN